MPVLQALAGATMSDSRWEHEALHQVLLPFDAASALMGIVRAMYGQAHTALADALLTADVIRRMTSEADSA